MIECGKCEEWYHPPCIVATVPKGFEAKEDVPFTCHFCETEADKKGFQRWKKGRKQPKKRHLNDRPIARKDQPGGELPPSYSAPPTWEGKVAETRERAQRAAVEKKNLEAAVQEIIDGGGHHMVDRQGLNGLEPLENNGLIQDDLLFNQEVHLEDDDDGDEDLALEDDEDD